ncbi:MAG TPA: hypothetical protein VFR90_01415 [Methylibium sp.]|uniref:hypothetical protein n=1 Tax=Methylibium sp. TaxID=2067992 RepID=UPI002DBF756F|nr:hypothetical protein [Methylibium sp.]HEU4457764.1 hypothetical protein [Methylibium sp.]
MTPQLALLAPHAAEGFEAVITDFLGMAYEAGAADPASYRNWTFEDWLGTADTQGAVSWNEVRHA